MKRQLTLARKDFYRIVYLDEKMFTRSTVPKSEWILPKDNLRVDQDKLKEPTLALLSAISKEKGQEHYQIFEKSVNIPKFKQYLQELRAANGDDKICLFLDNLSTHRSTKSINEMQALGFRHIFNLPYSPQYNAIEFTFSKISSAFQSLRARLLTGNLQMNHYALVHKAVKSVRK